MLGGYVAVPTTVWNVLVLRRPNADGVLFLRAIGPCNRMGDVGHGSCRIANAVAKRLNETIKGFIETAASDLAKAAREAGKALVLELHQILDEVKNVPHAERLAPRPTKAGKFDITGGKMFLRIVHCMHGL